MAADEEQKSDDRLVKVDLDDAGMPRRSAEAEQERAIAIYDLIEENFLAELITYLKSNSPDIVILNSSSFQEQGQVEFSRRVSDSLIVYKPDDNDLFLTDQGSYLTYVGCVVIRKKLWRKFS